MLGERRGSPLLWPRTGFGRYPGQRNPNPLILAPLTIGAVWLAVNRTLDVNAQTAERRGSLAIETIWTEMRMG